MSISVFESKFCPKSTASMNQVQKCFRRELNIVCIPSGCHKTSGKTLSALDFLFSKLLEAIEYRKKILEFNKLYMNKTI